MSATQLLEQVLARIDQNGSAFTLVDADGARLSALESDRLIAAGRARSPLEGLPVSSKDLFDVEGQITTAGSSALRGFAPANKDAPVIAALRKAGAVIVGRTHMRICLYRPWRQSSSSPLRESGGREPCAGWLEFRCRSVGRLGTMRCWPWHRHGRIGSYPCFVLRACWLQTHAIPHLAGRCLRAVSHTGFNWIHRQFRIVLCAH